MRELNDVYEFDGGKYLLVEDNIIPEKQKNKFVIYLNLVAIALVIIGAIFNSIVIRKPYTIELANTKDFIISIVLIFLASFSFLVYVVVHELLHGWAFRLFNKNTKKQIKFGIVWKSGMAFCISTIPVTVKASRRSLMMPVYVVCLPMFLLAVVFGNVWLGLLAIMYFSGSVGDIYYMWKLRRTDKDLYMYEEMPTKSGYEIGYLLFKKID